MWSVKRGRSKKVLQDSCLVRFVFVCVALFMSRKFIFVCDRTLKSKNKYLVYYAIYRFSHIALLYASRDICFRREISEAKITSG